MNNLDGLNLVVDVRKALVKICFHPDLVRDLAVDSIRLVRFDIVKRTRFGRFLILRLADKRTGTRLYQLTVEHPWLLRFLSGQLGRPIRIVEEFDGRVSLVIEIVPFSNNLRGLCSLPPSNKHSSAVA